MVLRDPGHEKQLLLYILLFVVVILAGGLYAFAGGI